MQFSAMTFSFGPGSLDSICQAIMQQGFDTVDLAAGNRHQINKFTAARYPHDEARWVRKVLATYKLDVSEVFLLNLDVPMNYRGRMRPNMYEELFNGFIEFCREIGAESIMMSPGKLNNEIGEAASRQLAVDALRFQHEVCSTKGLQLNIEPHWHSLAESPESAIWFCEQVPGIGLTLDYSHFIAQGYTQDDVEQLHAYTRHFHARQARKGATNATITDGTIDFKRIMHKFQQDHWDGVICLEYNPSLIEDALGEIQQLKQQLTSYLLQDLHTPSLVKDTGQQWIRIVFDPEWCRTCKLCEMVCSIYHEGEARPALARIDIDFDAFKEVDPIYGTVCRQCPDAPCMDVCPEIALSRDTNSGAVIVDRDLCIGCMACQSACPWDVPKLHPDTGVAIKCDLCMDNEDGPICVEMCPLSGKALRYVKSYITVGQEVV